MLIRAYKNRLRDSMFCWSLSQAVLALPDDDVVITQLY